MGNTVQPMRSSFADTDVVSYILTSLPDFRCLEATILTSKSIHNVFQQHPRSIVRSVAYNLVGPALPQALRLVRCSNAQLYSKPVGELLCEDDIHKNSVLSNKEIMSLMAISSSIQELEGVFSRRMKDRRSETSRLSLAESMRFQRAMYRLCLFSAVYGCTANMSAAEANSVREAQKLRKGFFGRFSTPELREIQKVEVFLRGIIARTDVQTSLVEPQPSYRVDSLTSYVIYSAPHKVLDVYKGRMTPYFASDWHDNMDLSFCKDFMTGPLASVLVDRNEPYLLLVGHEQPILDEVIGEHDRCSQCQSDSVQGLDLWGPENWRYLWRGPTCSAYLTQSLLKGYLHSNKAYDQDFRDELWRTPPEQMIAGLFDCKTSAYDTWNEEDWLCRQCLETFMHNHLHVWYLNQKVKRGHLIPVNCYYGYDCISQDKYAHAKELNHLCEPVEVRI
ncbi:hypothetical protein DFH29DRAFT_1066851 [Suillus ampliporus]|nr:hypothetical protein DFH29DRAFT_1066851 [Suillus ampliporus]